MFAALFICLGLQTGTTTFTDGDLNVVFDHPKAWTISRRDKRQTEWRVPIEGSSDVGQLFVVKSTYRGEADLWQTIQLRSAEISKRKVVRQWSQDIISTPLLCTQLEYTEKGVNVTELSALYYRAGARKMLVRLVAPTTAYDNLRYQLQQVLETLRTVDGSTPKPEDPDAPIAPVTKKTEPTQPVKVLSSGSESSKYRQAKQSLTVRIAERDVTFRYPEDWTAERKDGGSVTLAHPKLSGLVTLHFQSPLDSPPPDQSLINITVQSLAKFTTVSHREDFNIEANQAGTRVWTVWRTGKAAGGDLAIFDAVGAAPDNYFTLTYRGSDLKVFPAERALLQKLLTRVGLSPVP